MSLGPPYDVVCIESCSFIKIISLKNLQWKSHAIKTRIENTITVAFAEDDPEVTPKLNASTNTSTLPEDKIKSRPAANVTAGVDAEIMSGDLTSPEVPRPKFSVKLSPSYALCFQSMWIYYVSVYIFCINIETFRAIDEVHMAFTDDKK